MPELSDKEKMVMQQRFIITSHINKTAERIVDVLAGLGIEMRGFPLQPGIKALIACSLRDLYIELGLISVEKGEDLLLSEIKKGETNE